MSMSQDPKPKRVLVIDDDEQYLALTARLLRSAGYDVLTRSEGLGTCSTIATEQPDMVLMDVNMPSVDGDRLAHLIQHRPEVRPILALYSGMEATAFERRAKACGADATIPKGLLPAQFLERVARAFARSSGASSKRRA